MPRQPFVYLDRAERNLLAKIKEKDPSYANLEVADIAHLELKTRLLEVLRNLKDAGGRI